MSSQKPTTGKYSSLHKNSALCWMRDKIKELPLIDLTLYLSLCFWNKS